MPNLVKSIQAQDRRQNGSQMTLKKQNKNELIGNAVAPIGENRIAVFKGKEIRKVIYKNEWWFVINDVIATLTDSVDPAQYFKRLKQRDPELAKLIAQGGVQFVPPLLIEVLTAGGPQKMYCWNTQGIFRLIQSIPSPKAEPFKRWLAKVGYERVQEIEDPELGTKRTKALYRAKGYSDEWVERRMRGIAIRQELTDEWKHRGAKEDTDYSILTAEISKATFGLTPSEYKAIKGLDRENLRDHMTDLELIFNMLGEAATTEITRNRNSKGFPLLKDSAHRGGKIAGDARNKLEIESGRKVVTSENYLDAPEGRKRLQKKSN
jgi:DNA-damage-inducible protein D